MTVSELNAVVSETRIAATPETVFAFFVDPNKMVRWMGSRVEVDPSPGGIYALEHHVERLRVDHENAQRLAQGLAGLRGIDIDPKGVETNLVFFQVTAETGWTAPDLARAVREHGIEVGAFGPTLIRAVTHLGVSRDDIERALAVFERVLRNPRSAAAQ